MELGKKPQYQGLIHSFQVLCEARACIICDCLTGCSKTSRKRHSINEKSSFSEAGDFFFFVWKLLADLHSPYLSSSSKVEDRTQKINDVRK